MSDQSNASGSRRKSNKTWNEGGLCEPSIHLRDIFGSQHSYEDDPSKRKSLDLEESAASFASEGGNTATTKESSTSKSPSLAASTASTKNRKQPAVERIRRPVRTTSSSGHGQATTASAGTSTGPIRRASSEKSIRLKDVFGSQFSFEDDPSKRKSVESFAIVEEEEEAASTNLSTAASTSSHGKSIRQRKSAAERIRRPNRSNNNSQESSASTISTSSQPTKRTPRRSKSNSTIHRVLSEDSMDGISPMENSKRASRARDHSSAAVESGLVSVMSSPAADASCLSKAEEGDLHGSSHHTTSNHDESQVSFFEDEPSLSSSSKQSRSSQSNNNLAQPLVAKTAFKTEPPKRTWCISCGIFLGLMGVFGLTQAFSILLWKPEPILLSEEIKLPITPPQDPSILQTTAAAVSSKAATPNTLPAPPANPLQLQAPPESEFEAAEESILGHLSKETLHRINENEDSPQAMALRWFHADPHWETYPPQRRQQRFALATLYFGTNPPFEHQWKNAGHWLSYDVSECEWLTAKDSRNLCQHPHDSKKDVVTFLPLDGNNLQGELPPEVSLLTSLTAIDIRGNQGLTGRLPEPWCGVADLFYDCAIQSALTPSGVCGCGQCDC